MNATERRELMELQDMYSKLSTEHNAQYRELRVASLERDEARHQAGKLGGIIHRQRLALKKLKAELELRLTEEEKLAKAAKRQWHRDQAFAERVGLPNG